MMTKMPEKNESGEPPPRTPRRTQIAWWLNWSGSISLVIAVATFQLNISNITSFLGYLIALLTIIGFALLLIGWLIRQPSSTPDTQNDPVKGRPTQRWAWALLILLLIILLDALGLLLGIYLPLIFP